MSPVDIRIAGTGAQAVASRTGSLPLADIGVTNPGIGPGADAGSLRVSAAPTAVRPLQRSVDSSPVAPVSRALAGRPPLTALALSPIASGSTRPPSAATTATATVPVPVPVTAAAPVLTLPPVSREAPASSAAAPAPFVDAGRVAVDAGIAHWDTDGSVVFHAPGDEPPVQRQATMATATTAVPTPSPAPDQTWAPEVPVISRALAAGAEPERDGGRDLPAGLPGTDWDDLVHRLHEEIRWRIRAELRQDAETFPYGSGIR